ncbi:MAG: HAD family hydrolase [Promethearchaeota archaeon]
MEFIPTLFERFKIKLDDEFLGRMREEIIGSLTGKSSKFLILKLILRSAKKMGLNPLQRIKFLMYLRRLYKKNIDEVDLIPGTLETFKFLKSRGHHVALFTTSSSKDFKVKFRNKRELFRYVDTYVVQDDVRYMKPDPEGVFKIKQRLGIEDQERIVIVGDMTHDIHTGSAIGAVTVGVLTGVESKEELEKAGAHLILDSVKDIPPNYESIINLLNSSQN